MIKLLGRNPVWKELYDFSCDGCPGGVSFPKGKLETVEPIKNLLNWACNCGAKCLNIEDFQLVLDEPSSIAECLGIKC